MSREDRNSSVALNFAKHRSSWRYCRLIRALANSKLVEFRLRGVQQTPAVVQSESSLGIEVTMELGTTRVWSSHQQDCHGSS